MAIPPRSVLRSQSSAAEEGEVIGHSGSRAVSFVNNFKVVSDGI